MEFINACTYSVLAFSELQETQGTASEKLQYDRAKAEDVRLKAMEKLPETEKRGS